MGSAYEEMRVILRDYVERVAEELVEDAVVNGIITLDQAHRIMELWKENSKC